MIDSITTGIDYKYFKLLEGSKFETKKVHNGAGFNSFSAFSEKYRKEQLKKGRYFPMVKVQKSKRGKSEELIYLEIQVSLPKLIYGTNLFEIDESDYNTINDKLYNILQELKVGINRADVENAILRKVDFSKNVITPTYLGEANFIINKLKDFNYKQSSKYQYKEYNDAGNGVSMKLINSTQGYAIYDKFGEIISNGQTKEELEIITGLHKDKFWKNVIRFEFSLQRKDSLSAFLKNRLREKKNSYLLKDIFNATFCKQVILEKFNNVFNNLELGLLSVSEMEDNKLLFYLAKSKLSINKQMKLCYWVRLARIYGISGTWDKIQLNYSGASVSRTKKEISLILEELGQINGNLPNIVEYCRQEHVKFKIIKPNYNALSLSTIVK